ncbi:MAG: hypothetical protein QOG80_2299 [Pseudonocardiales bacterium]|jgi:hypothetical protein|nr:hypothetical protein [Pseudonocardiales bacterium]
MRRITALLAPLAAVATLVVAPAAHAESMRMNVPESALTSYRAVASQFADPAAAVSANYTKISDLAGIFCIADPAGSGAMGIHYVNFDRLFDGGTLDPQQPEAIVYEAAPNGSLHLVALEYIVLQGDWGPTRPELFSGHPFDATEAGNRFGLPAYYSQHVWVGKGNPYGDLSMWNPAVHCR